MAGNQTRTVELQIKLQGVQSLQELEQITSEINDELKQVDINSEEFKKLGSMAQHANSRVKEIGQSLEGVTSTEKAEAINKMGAALLGVFQGAAGASLLFGEQTSEQMNKAIKAVGGLFAITDGLKKITEAFSAQNIARLKAVVGGWNDAAKSAKIFGVTVKSALISTGIGAFIVALGVLVANFDKIKGIFSNNAIAKNAEAEKKLLEGIEKQYEARLNADKQILDYYKERYKYTKEAQKLANVELENAQVELDVKYATHQKLKAEYKENEARLKKMVGLNQEERNEMMKRQDVIKEELRGLGELRRVNEERLAQGKFALVGELERLEIIKMQKYWYVEVAKAIQDNNDAIDESQNAIIRINAEENNKRKLYLENLNILGKQLDSIVKQQQFDYLNTEELKKQKATLEAQVDALNTAETIRLRELRLSLEKLKAETAYNDALNKQLYTADALAMLYEEIAQSNDEALGDANRRTKQAEYEAELFTRIAEIRNEIANFDKKGLEIFEKYYEVEYDLYKQEAERLGITDDFNKLTKEQQRILGEQLLAVKDINDAKINGFNTELKNNDALLNNLDMQIEAQKKIADVAQARIFELEKERVGYQDKLATVKKGSEEELYYLEKIKNVNDEIAGAVDTRVGAENEITNVTLKQNQLLETNRNIQADIDSTVQETADAQKEVTYEIEKQVRLSSQLKNFISDYAEEIETTRQLIGQTFELMATMNDARAEDKQREIDAFLEAEEAKTDIVARNAEAQADAKAKAEEAYNDRIMELYDMLADAEGEHYDDLLDEIAAQEAAKEEAYRAEIDRQNAEGLAEWQKNDTLAKMENEKAMYEYRAAKQRKIAAIIDATIQTALATIKALPNVVLAGITAALGVAGIATISAQKLPPEPAPYESTPYVPIPYKKGGYTGEGDVNQPAGIVHKEEYVVPEFVMKNPKAIPMVQTLEGIRQRGYAEGGYVTTPAMAAEATQSAIDYKMIGTEVANAMKDNPMFVSWKEWRDINSKMEFVYSRAGLRKR